MALAITFLALTACADDTAAPSLEESCSMLLGQRPVAAANPVVIISDATESVNAATGPATEAALAEASLAGKDYLLISVNGGDAVQVSSGRLSDDSDPYSQTRKLQAEHVATCVAAEIGEKAKPSTPGTDLHSAFVLASSLVPLGQGDLVVVITDGLINVGPWALDGKNTQSDSPSALGEALVADAPVDLGGAKIVWSGVADSPGVPVARIAWLQGFAQGLCAGMNADGCTEIRATGKSQQRDVMLAVSEVADPAVTWAEPTVLAQPEAKSCTVTLPGGTLFASDSAELSPEAKQGLAEWLTLVRSGASVTITGHTASPPNSDPAALVSFSERRAQAVRDELVARGADPAKLHLVGAGDTQPVVDATFPDGSLNEALAGANRRVEILVEGVTTCPAD